MKSKSKNHLDNLTIKKIFEKISVTEINGINKLSEGEYNTLYEIAADGKSYMLKVAPSCDFKHLTYENDMMKSEIFWYDKMRKETQIPVPEVYFTDFTKTVIPADYFIMEKIDGALKSKTRFTKEEKEQANTQLIKQLADLHSIRNDKFGYVQGSLFDNWYDAYTHIVKGHIGDIKRAGKKSKNAELILSYAEKYKDILTDVQSCAVNTDCWDTNIICKKENNETKLVWIDPERSMWGDRLFDFICLDPMTPIENQKDIINTYNAYTDDKLIVGKNEVIRYAFCLALLALVMDAEKHYRYTPLHYGWWRNVISSKMFYENAFKVLKK